MDGFRYFNDSWSRSNFKVSVDIVRVRKRGLGRLKECSIYKRTEARHLSMENLKDTGTKALRICFNVLDFNP